MARPIISFHPPPTSNSPPKRAFSVFVDANIFLSLYAYSNDDLEQLKRVKNLIADTTITLYEPNQVFDEIARNREGKIAEAIGEFSKQSFSTKLPILMRGFEDASRFNKACSIAERLRNNLISRTRQEAEERRLPADSVIEELLSAATRIPVTDDIYIAALARNRSGNPPGKGGNTVGDEINWESLLSFCPEGTDLHIVSKDGDYRSPLGKSKPRGFLVQEWQEKKKGNLIWHAELGPFLRSIDNEIKLATEARKKELIAKLISSPSFASTHTTIENLAPYLPLFTIEDVEEIVRGSIDNPQVHWIVGDNDVKEFFEAALNTNLDKLDPKTAQAARSKLLQREGENEHDEDTEDGLQRLIDELLSQK